MYSKLINKLLESCIVEIMSNAVEIEMEFVVDTLPVELIGMNLAMLCDYIKFCADRLLLSLGCNHHKRLKTHLNGWRKSVYRVRLTSLKSD